MSQKKQHDEGPSSEEVREEIQNSTQNLASQAAQVLSGWENEPLPDLGTVVVENWASAVRLKDHDFVESQELLGSQEPQEAFVDVEGTELEGFETASLEEEENLAPERIVSIIESLLFATDRPQSVAVMKSAFKDTQVRSEHIRQALDQLQIEYAGSTRGVYLEEVVGGFQLRTKSDNKDYLRRMTKVKSFRVSGPALETLSIVAYKQPVTKSHIDEIRGVESGHLLRALMEKGLVHFAGKSELPGKPMLYGTTRKFLEIFGLRNLQELPSLHEIDQLIPEGIGEEEEKLTLDSLSQSLSQDAGSTYSEGEEELLKISQDLEKVSTTTEFFEQEKQRQKARRDLERAQDLRDALTVGETVSESDLRWLERYEQTQQQQQDDEPPVTTSSSPIVL